MTVFYENLLNACEKLIHEPPHFSLLFSQMDNEIILYRDYSLHDCDKYMHMRYYYYSSLENNSISINEGSFTIERITGIITKENILGVNISFHEIMSKFFVPEIGSFLQNILKQNYFCKQNLFLYKK
jgi:hypothetical protein